MRFEALFRRPIVRLGYVKTIWDVVPHMAVVIWKILHQGVRYVAVEMGLATTPQAARRRAQRVVRQLPKLGYAAHITPLSDIRP